MNVAEWILVAILAVTLFIFLVVGIVLMVKIIGMTGEDLLAAGWYISYYIEETGEVVMGYTPYAFTVVFDGDVEIDEDSEDDFDIIVEARNEAIRPLTVVSVTFFRIGDALSYE